MPSERALGICTWLCAKTCSNRLVCGWGTGADADAAREAGLSPPSVKPAAPIFSCRLSRLFQLLSGSACAACCCSGFWPASSCTACRRGVGCDPRCTSGFKHTSQTRCIRGSFFQTIGPSAALQHSLQPGHDTHVQCREGLTGSATLLAPLAWPQAFSMTDSSRKEASGPFSGRIRSLSSK